MVKQKVTNSCLIIDSENLLSTYYFSYFCLLAANKIIMLLANKKFPGCLGGLVKCLILDFCSGHDLKVGHEIVPLVSLSMEPAWDLSLSLSAPPLLILSQNK